MSAESAFTEVELRAMFNWLIEPEETFSYFSDNECLTPMIDGEDDLDVYGIVSEALEDRITDYND